jgi:hypothetical protein
LDLDHDFWVAHHWLSLAYAQTGRVAEALAAAEAARRLDDTLEIVAVRGYLIGLAGRRREALDSLEELRQVSSRRYVSPMLPALVHVGLSDHDAAFVEMERGFAEGAQMLSELRVEAAFDPLRSDPRFADLLRRVRLDDAEQNAAR